MSHEMAAGAPKLLSQNQAAQLGGDALRRRTQLSDSMLSCVYSSLSQEVIILIRILQLPPLSHLFFLPLKESLRNDDPSVRMETSDWLDYKAGNGYFDCCSPVSQKFVAELCPA